MELSQLKMVKAVARTGSIARAAEQLHCVPSNITNRLKQLEGELGTSLFIRAGRGLKISPDGEIFLGYSERILALVDEAKRAVDRQAEPSGILRIGAIESCAGGRLPPLLAEFHQRFPQVTLELVTGTWSQLFEELQHHRIDGALVAVDTPQPKLERTALYSEPLVLVASADAAPVLSPRDLQDQTLFMARRLPLPPRPGALAERPRRDRDHHRLCQLGHHHRLCQRRCRHDPGPGRRARALHPVRGPDAPPLRRPAADRHSFCLEQGNRTPHRTGRVCAVVAGTIGGMKRATGERPDQVKAGENSKHSSRTDRGRYGGNPTSHTPAHNVTAAAAPFQA